MKKQRTFSQIAAGFIAAATIISAVPMNAFAKETRESLEKDIVQWETSFTNKTPGFLESTVDKEKGSKNIKGFREPEKIKGDVTGKVDLDAISGSTDFNSSESKDKLFDGNSGTKFLTKAGSPTVDKPVLVQFELTSAQTLDRYAVVSANDSSERDPKSWQLMGSTNKTDWEVIDEQNDLEFKDRFERKDFTIKSPKAYQFYKFVVTKNKGNDGMTQLADILLGTGEEKDPEAETPMIAKIAKGPSNAWNQESNKGWTDSSSLEISGTHLGKDDAYSWNVLYKDLDVEITSETALSYLIFPGTIGDNYDYNWTQMNMSVDLKFDDGKYLSDYKIDDVNGNLLTPKGQGDSRTLLTNQWNKITARLGEYQNLRGKKITQVLVAYDNKDNKADQDVDFKNYLDDIKIYKEALKDYDNDNLAEYVNILRGTNDSPNFSRGLTAPLVTMPHGFNFWAPVTNSGDNKLYTYQQNGNTGTLKHISVSHEPSYWVGDRGNWEFMVNTSLDIKGDSSIGASERAAKFSHENETAKAHYYGVSFDEGNAKGSKLELSPTTHGAIAKFSFDNTATYRNVILDLVRGSGKNVTLNSDKKSFTAKMTPDNSNGMKTMYVYGEFDKVWSEQKYGNANNNSAIVNFGNESTVEMKVATSFISPEQAQKNLELELGGKTFENIYDSAKKEWNDKLDVMTVEGATHEQKVTLYSNLYRMFAYPNLLSENTGTKDAPVWKYKSTVDDNVKDGTIYYNNGFWDTYHTTWAGYELLTPGMYEEMLNGLVEHYNDGGWVPRWIAPGGTNSMVGTSSDVIFGDAAAKGANFELEDAYKSALKNASVANVENLTKGGRNELNTSLFRGYTSNSTGEGFSWSMEGYINDYGISQMAYRLAEEAKAKGDTKSEKTYLDEAEYYKNRALNYVNLFDGSGETAKDKWFKGKNAKGEWSSGDSFDPYFWGDNYTETNAFNMTVTVPQDGYGLANLYGGSEALAERIDTIFNTKGTYNGYGASNGVGGIHEQREAREVKLGQYGHSNQPSHGIIYMYNYASQPWKTQKYVRDVLQRCYVGADFGQGYIGDEDNGEMSGWYILSSLGFFPVNMGSGEFAIGSPLFEKATLHLENGKELVINAKNNSQENVYVQSMKVNGQDHNSSFISAKTLTEGGTIDFTMGSQPNKDWGTAKDGTSITKGTELPNPEEDLTTSSLLVSEDIAIDAAQDAVAGKDITDIKNLFDNNSNNAATFKEDTSVYYSFLRPVKVNMMTLTSTKDKQANAPKEFILSGSDDGQNWTELTNQKDVTFEWGRYTRPFSIETDKGYQYYKLDLKGGTTLSEVELLGQSDDLSGIDKTLLLKVITRAASIDTTLMSKDVQKLLSDGIEAAQKVYDEENATPEQIIAQYEALNVIIKRVENIRDGFVKIEAETFDTSHSSIVNDGKNIGGVKKDTWVGYRDVEFKTIPTHLEAFYSAQDKDSCAKGKIEVRLDSREGEPLFSLDTTKTGGWSNYKLTEIDIPKEVRNQFIGLHDVYFTFVGKDPVDEAMAYVSNVDYFTFSQQKIALNITAEGEGEILTKDLNAVFGEDFIFEIKAKDGYKAIEVTVDGKKLEDYVHGTNKITLNDITEVKTVIVKFAEDKDFDINIKDGTVEDAKVKFVDKDGKEVTSLKAGETGTIIVSDIADGMTIKEVLINGKEIKMMATKTASTSYMGLFIMPYDHIEVTVTLSDLPRHKVAITKAENGEVITSGDISGDIIDDKSLIITATPHPGYKLTQLIVNGKEVDIKFDGQNGGSYTIDSVKEDIEIEAVFKPIRDVSSAKTLIAQAKDVVANAKDAKIETLALEKAIDNLQKNVDNDKATQEDINNAMSKVRVELSKLYIDIYLSAAYKINFSQYTDETVKVFKDVLNEAKELLKKENVTEKELNDMIIKLSVAEENLKEKTPDIDGGEKPGDNTGGNTGDNTGGNTGGNQNGGQKPNGGNDAGGTTETEDTTQMQGYILVLILVVLGTAITVKKRKVLKSK